MSDSRDPYGSAYPKLIALAAHRARRVLRDSDEAEEVAQEALLRAYVAWEDIEPFAPQWVSRVAVNLAISRLRQRYRLCPEGFVASSPASIDTQIDVTRAVAELPLRQRQVVVLRHIADLAEREVAELLDISTGAVKRHLHRALATLRSPGSSLAAEYSTTTINEEKDVANLWRSLFEPAVEPPCGWPTRPWDHRYLEDEDSVVRVAIDQAGAVVLDGDGDEVQSGPGFNHEAAKIRRGNPKTEREEPTIPVDRLTPEVLVILGRAGRIGAAFGHCWLGTEHLALALVEQNSKAQAIVGTSWDNLARAVAEFYEGPHAAARLVLVTDRLDREWDPLPVPGEVAPVPNCALRQLLHLSADAAESARRKQADAVDVSEELVHPTRWSLVSQLLGRPLGSDPGAPLR